MRLLLISLLILSFIQTSMTTIDIVVVLLVAKAFKSPETINYWIAFGFGLLISFLSGQALGILSIYYLLVIFLCHIIARSRLSNNWLITIPVALGLFISKELVDLWIGSDVFSWRNVIIQLLLLLPIYFWLLFLDERVLGKSEMRLKLKS
jgi:rod shape-determining protein MreD